MIGKFISYNWRFYYEGDNYKKFAGCYDIIWMHYEPARENTPPMPLRLKAVAPNLKVMLYRNSRAIYKHEIEELALFRQNKWLLLTPDGEEITARKWTAQRLVDKGNPAYQAYLAKWIKTWVSNGGYDGVILDDIYGNNQVLYDCVGIISGCDAQKVCIPINPRTGKAFTNTDWLAADLQIIRAVKQALGTKPVMGNVTWTGINFWRNLSATYSTLLKEPTFDGFMIEGFVNWGTGWLSEGDWKQSIDEIIWVEQNLPRTKSVIVAGDSWKTIPTDTTRDEFALYCFASLMLGMSPTRNYYIFEGPTGGVLDNNYCRVFSQWLHTLNFGNPLGAYYTLGVTGAKVYIREFENGMVLVNPTIGSVTVNLPKIYRTITGESVSTLNVPGHRAALLFTVSGAIEEGESALLELMAVFASGVIQ